jgi:hypothetical protein
MELWYKCQTIPSRAYGFALIKPYAEKKRAPTYEPMSILKGQHIHGLKLRDHTPVPMTPCIELVGC